MISFLVAIIVTLAGRQFYNLAIAYNKNRFLFGFVGIASYFFGIFLGTFFITIVAPDFSNKSETGLLASITVPVGVLTAIVTYFLLKRAWSK